MERPAARERPAKPAQRIYPVRLIAETYLPDPLRVLRKEQLKRVQLLRHTLDIVKPVHANDDLDASKPCLKLLDPLLHALFLDIL